MSPILGIWASSISGSKAITSNFISLQTATVDASGAATITFNSIPSTYKHLQLRAISKCTSAGASFGLITMNFNSDTTAANYTYHRIAGSGAIAQAYSTTALGYSAMSYITTNDASISGMFAGAIIDILDYTDTNKYKTIRSLSGFNFNNNTGYIGFMSSLWLSTSAITSITIGSQSDNLAQYTQFALYGVK